MPIKPNELTKEMVIKAMQCKDADELTALSCAAINLHISLNKLKKKEE